MKRLFIIIIILFLPSLSLGQETKFSDELSGVFEDYYLLVRENKIAHSQEKLAADIKSLLVKYTSKKEETAGPFDFDSLEKEINKILKVNNQRIVLFVIPESEVINCWLGEVIEEKERISEVFGKKLNFNTIALDKLKIRDYLCFLTNGEEMLDVGTRDNNIFYNLEATRKKASGIWDFFTDRKVESHKMRYDPSKLNRLRKHLQQKAWRVLYEELQDYQPEFIEKATRVIKENNFTHELAHIYLKDNHDLEFDSTKEEEFAFLFELSYGNILFDYLDTIVGIYAKGLKSIYYEATKNVLEGFISVILSEYKYIPVKGRYLTDRIENLYLLEADQIRAIAEKLFKNFLLTYTPRLHIIYK